MEFEEENSENIMEELWHFSTTYRKSRVRSSDNSISIVIYGYDELSVYVLNSKL